MESFSQAILETVPYGSCNSHEEEFILMLKTFTRIAVDAPSLQFHSLPPEDVASLAKTIDQFTRAVEFHLPKALPPHSLPALRQKVAQAADERKSMEQERHGLEADIQRLAERLGAVRQDRDTAAAVKVKTQKDVDDCEKECAQLHKERVRLDVQLDKLRAQLAAVSSESAVLHSKIESAAEALSSGQSERDALTTRRDALSDELQTVRDGIAALEAELRLLGELEKLKEAHERLRVDYPEMSAHAEALGQASDRCKSRREQFDILLTATESSIKGMDEILSKEFEEVERECLSVEKAVFS